MNSNNYRELTEEEKRNLSFELKICYYLRGWNSSFNPKNFEDWIEGVWITFSYENNDWKLEHGIINEKQYKDECFSVAREEYNRLYDFITKYILV